MDVKSYILTKLLFKQSGNDNSFWKSYQDDGKRTDYSYAFRNAYWTNENFNPIYKAKVTKAYYTFTECKITDYEKLASYFDFSNCPNLNYTFAHTSFTRLKELNFTSATTATSTFANSQKLHTIDKIVINSDGSFPFENKTFQSCFGLVEIRFEGIIGTSFYIHNSPKLSKESIINIFEALSSSTSAQSVNLSKEAVNAAFQTSTGLNNGTSSDEWQMLIATKPNWTVNLT